MRKLLFLIPLFLFAPTVLRAQVFSWTNPNTPKDSLQKDSIIAAKISADLFRKDTLDFIRSPKKQIFDEGVLVKNDRSRIFGDLNSKGSIIRGVSFGNNQGSSVQSSMDLQITGKLSEDVSVLASISDHNLPVQADGYTQTLDEFDKIYLQLNIRKKSILRAGHLDLDNDVAYFAKYQRRSMGLEYQTVFGDTRKTFLNLSAGVARSEFHRMRFQASEGNQGPYRLGGKNGETYITIISGSEQVYIDGILMKRGENLDYIINYNTGEVTFTSFRPVYAQNFITISYNYTNRNYSRFLVTGSLRNERERLKTGFSWFLENDNKNAPLSINLSDEDKEALAAAGSDPNRMYAPSGIQTEYDVNKILYEKIAGAEGNFYQFSTNENAILYQVNFTYFGSQLGDYRLKQTLNNGTVFEYAGSNMGDYRAVTKLPAPQKTQVFSGNVEYLLNDGKIGADFSLSNYDRNLFSAVNNGDNTGYAARIFGSKTFRKNNWRGISEFEMQHIDRRFHILDRINEVEFSRDFNLTQEFSSVTQNRLIFSFANVWKNKAELKYRMNYLNETDQYKGFKNDLNFFWKTGKFSTNGQFSYLDTKSTDLNTVFIRGNILNELNGARGSWGIGASMEHNSKKIAETAMYDATSFSWKEIFVQKKVGDSANTRLLTRIYLRENDSVRSNRLENRNHILGFMAESKLIRNDKTQLSALLHYRKFYYPEENQQKNNRDFIIGNLTYSQQLFGNGMRLQAFYELGNGQEAQRSFQYIKVTDGQGIYKWTDYNGDGVQQLDEFETAEYADLARYIRVYTNTISYVPSNKNKLQFSLFVNPYVVFNSANAFLRRWNFNASLLSQNSFYKNDKAVVLDPFRKEASQILKNQNILISALFNPTDTSGWSGNYRYLNTTSLINANQSAEQNEKESHSLIAGYRISERLRADWENSAGNTHNRSELYESRNYLLHILSTQPKVTYRFSGSMQSDLSTSYILKTRTDGDEQLKMLSITGALQWEHHKTSLRGSFSFVNNDFSGNSYSLVANQMLDGLKAGKNQVWSLYLQQNINTFLILNINYEGRNSGNRTIHIGSVQLKASF